MNPTIQVRLPPCALEITVARLTRANHATVTFTATPQAPATDGSITVLGEEVVGRDAVQEEAVPLAAPGPLALA